MTLVHSLDGHPLEIKQLKGQEPVEAIDLSSKRLGLASAIVIASLIGTNTATKSLKCAPPPLMTDLVNCQLTRCALVTLSADYSLANNSIPAECAKALCEALKINNALQTLKYATSYPANLLSQFVY